MVCGAMLCDRVADLERGEGESMIRTKGRRRLTCYHEAGHALARWYCGHFFDRVLVLTVEQVRRSEWPKNRRGFVRPDIEGMVDGYALGPSPALGPEHYKAMSPEALRFLQVDIEQELIDCLAGPIAEAAYSRRSVVTAMLWGGDGDMGRVRQLLNEWFPDPAARAQAYRLAARRTAALVRSGPGWRALTALAEALYESGELDWPEAKPVIEAAYGREQPQLRMWMEAWPPTLEMIRGGRFPELAAA
jgi:hypothetical protein